MLDFATFYPTPPHLISKIIAKIKGYPKKVLEPSGGKGDLIEGLQGSKLHHKFDISVIEIEKDLRAILRSKGCKVIDHDFLAYSGPDKFDLIIANPPFDQGEKHLLKAINIMYRGQIIFLLNAETIRNPYTNTRKELARQLDELGAEIEFIENGFMDAERKTAVEVALINIKIERQIEDDLFVNADDTAAQSNHTVGDKYELTTGKHVSELVAEYNQVVDLCTNTIVDYYKNFRKVGKYIGLNKAAKECSYSSSDLTGMVQDHVNDMLKEVRRDFWRKTLELKEVKNRMTEKKQNEFEHIINTRCEMDFTENNIRTFILNLIDGYEQTLMDAVLEIFDRFTIRHCFDDNLYTKNIHYFNGWKTNKAFKVGKKVIIPIYASYGNPFVGWHGWELDYKAARTLQDIDIVMNYFDGMQNYLSIADAIKEAFKLGQTSSINSTYFKITTHKKGTIHLTFLDDNILRRFNVAACKGKGWLPNGYGKKRYGDLLPDERATADSFEGEESYEENVNQPLFSIKPSTLQIAA